MSQIAALSLEEVKRLLYAAMFLQNGVAAASVAIGIFGGLRPSEICDLKTSDIGENVIRVSGGKLRRKLKRTVPIPSVLAAWLKLYPFTGLPTGWDYKMKALKKLTKAKKWVQDIIRHTSISYQADRDKNEALTAYNCGTSIQMMNQHYRHTIDEENAISEFWNLTPAKLMENKPEVALPKKPAIDWPEKAKLKKLVWAKPLIHAAKDIGVSDVALKKRCVKLDIQLPPRGHWA
jgi:integrase